MLSFVIVISGCHNIKTTLEQKIIELVRLSAAENVRNVGFGSS